MKTNKAQHITGSVSRTLLALTFLFSGFVKAVDPLGTVYKIEDYLKAFGGFCTDLLPLAGTAAVCLILVEWLLGWAMLFNVRTKVTSWIALAFYLVMTPLTLCIALTNPVTDCGCFGDALVLTNWQTFWKNIVLTALVIVLLVCRKAIPQLFQWKAEATIAAIGLVIAGGIMLYSYTHLPPLDFRPYKVGNHIPTLMEVPEEYVPDTTIVTLTYVKDGVQKQFNINNYPKGDTEWQFVDQKTVYAKKVFQNGILKGTVPVEEYHPPIHDFEIENLELGDITYDVLYSETPITLVVMYDLNKINRTQIHKLLNIYNTRSDVYFLTGSGENEILAFAEEAGWDEETMMRVFCFTDPVTLKTIVRANPGIIVIQNGNIIDKYNLRNK